MKLVYFSGGLGNQLFEYAFYRKLQILFPDEVIKADLSWYDAKIENRDFRITEVFPRAKVQLADESEASAMQDALGSRGLIRRVINHFVPNSDIYIREIDNGTYDAGVLKKRKDAFYIGGWQSEQYFKDISDKIKKELTFQTCEPDYEALLEEISGDRHSIVMHIRRGDYLDDTAQYGGICTEAYYSQAMDMVTSQDSGASWNLYLVSDDTAFAADVADRYSSDKVAASVISRDKYGDYPDWYDMKLISSGQNVIMANSSFSWWGSWLNAHEDKTIIAPVGWSGLHGFRDIIPDGWMRVTSV